MGRSLDTPHDEYAVPRWLKWGLPAACVALFGFFIVSNLPDHVAPPSAHEVQRRTLFDAYCTALIDDNESAMWAAMSAYARFTGMTEREVAGLAHVCLAAPRPQP
jgi:hypothetical protein